VNRDKLADVFLFLTVFLSIFLGLTVQEELLHQRFSEDMGCNTEMHWTPNLEKGFVMAVENQCNHLNQQELRALMTRHATVDTVFYAVNLLSLPMGFVLYLEMKRIGRKSFSTN